MKMQQAPSRNERDSLGELSLSADNYFGIGTARLIGAVPVAGPDFPVEILHNILLVRRAQAIAFGRNNTWSNSIASAVIMATERLVEDAALFARNVVVRPQHGGGVRSIVMNVDEVLANAALEEMGRSKGDYHIMAPLLQMDRGTCYLETYFTAFHLTIIDELAGMIDSIDSFNLTLLRKEDAFAEQVTLRTINFQDVTLSDMGEDFGRCCKALVRSRQQLELFRTMLLPCWQGSPEVLLAIKELTGNRFTVCQASRDFSWNVDLYVGLSAIMRVIAITLLNFCNKMRFFIGCTKELDGDRVRSNPPFSPAGKDFLIPDTVSQLVFSIIGGDNVVAAAASSGVDSAVAYAPLFSTQLIWIEKWVTLSLKLLDGKFVNELTGNMEIGAKKISETPLQAEGLVSIIGYDRAVQVARIAALTEKPVRMVVRKMKLLTEEQLDQQLSSIADEEKLT